MVNKKYLIAMICFVFLISGCSFFDEDIEMDTFNAAINGLDATKCSEIKNIILSERCNTVVKDSSFERNALNLQDKSYCDKISTIVGQNSCKSLYAYQENNIEQIQNIYNKHQQLLSVVKNDDVDYCNMLDTEQFIEECKINIYIKRAQAKKDPSICRQIEDKSYSDSCVESLN